MKILNHILDDSHSSSTMKPAKTTDQTTSKTSFNNNHHYHHHHHTQSVRTKATTVPDIPKSMLYLKSKFSYKINHFLRFLFWL